MRLVISFLMLFGVSSFAGNTEVVTSLDKAEPYEGMTFHDGVLWVGRSRKTFDADYSLEAYLNDKLAGTVTLSHAATFVYPYAKNSVIVVGVGYKPRLTQYTIVENNAGKLVARSHAIPIDAWARTWLGTHNGKEYFTDPGGNPQDQTLGRPAQTFFTVSRTSAPQYLSTRLRLPLAGLKVGNQFYVINAESIGSPEGNLYRLDPKTQTLTSVFPTNAQNVSGIAYDSGKNLIAVTEETPGHLNIVDASTSKVVSSIAVTGGARSVTFLGKCALVASRDTRQVSAIDVSDPKTPSALGTVDVDLPENDFMRLDKIAADPVSGKIYARSNYACNFMTQKCDWEWNKVLVFTSATSQDLAAKCLK